MSGPQDRLQINHEERRFLGVCAGIARYLDLPVALIRIIFVISIFTWPTLILAYFLVYFCLDRNITTEKVYDFFSGRTGKRNFGEVSYRRPLYRNMRNKRIAGVCSGIADYLEVRIFTVRLLAIISVFVLGPYSALAYAVCWFVMEPDPAPPLSPGKHKFGRRHTRRSRRKHREIASSRLNHPYHDGVSTTATNDYSEEEATANDQAPELENTRSVDECSEIFYHLETRMREIEAFMTSKRFILHCEINRI